MRIVISQDKEEGAGMMPLRVDRVEAPRRLHRVGRAARQACGATDGLKRQGFDGPCVVLVCGENGELYGRVPAGLPVMYQWEASQDTSGTPEGYLTGQKWDEFADLMRGWLSDPRPIGSVELR